MFEVSGGDEEIGVPVCVLGRELHQGLGRLGDVGALLVPDLLTLLRVSHHQVLADLCDHEVVEEHHGDLSKLKKWTTLSLFFVK